MDGNRKALAIRFHEDAALTATIVEAFRSTGLLDAGYAFVADLSSMTCGAFRAAEPIYPASVIKVPIMAEAFHRFDAGDLSPDDRVTIAGKNLTPTDEPTPFVSGYVATAGEMVERMITHSDNVATNQLIDVLRRERVTAFMRALGLESSFLGRKLSGAEPFVEDEEMTGRNRLPPDEIGRLLALIALDLVPGASEQRAILGRCVDGGKLAAGLCGGDRFMHKTGETSDTNHDAGILFTSSGARYVIVLYTTSDRSADPSPASRSNAAMAMWMRRVRQEL